MNHHCVQEFESRILFLLKAADWSVSTFRIQIRIKSPNGSSQERQGVNETKVVREG
jgi:hypothetical protein